MQYVVYLVVNGGAACFVFSQDVFKPSYSWINKPSESYSFTCPPTYAECGMMP